MDIENFVQNVKFYCERKGEKVTPACQAAGVGGSFINNMEARGSVPSVEKVQLLAHYLGCTVSELLGETSPGHFAGVGKLVETGPPELLPLHDSAVRISESDARRLTVSEVELVMSYRRADERTRTMVQLALEPFGKGEAADSAG